MQREDTMNEATLQQAASVIADNATIRIERRREGIHDPYAAGPKRGRNRLAIIMPCDTCKGSGEVTDADGDPDACPACLGLAVIEEDRLYEYDVVIVDMGHGTTVEISSLEGKGRIDRRRVRDEVEVGELVKTALGQIAAEVIKPAGVKDLDLATATKLRDIAVSTGVLSAGVADAHLAERVALLANHDLVSEGEGLTAQPEPKG